MESFSYITNTKGEQEGIIINFKDLKRMNLRLAGVIAALQKQEKEIDELINKSAATVTLADALGKLKGKLNG
ncbi:hypothetical protein [Solitalea lacus]|uniref:hypothetical protein n=1 Tax=Solitalea lacus TaxID=2911172 RepID=UPI001EDC37ED|nr:hypothetical protein [Solitalea lacus]UKJ08476.1 hypothetical protein L2B55_04735 [Solitalea lacus]